MKTKIAVKYFGSLQKMADAFGVSKQLVHSFGEYLPEGRAWQAEALSGGKLKVDAEFYRLQRLEAYQKRQRSAEKKLSA